MSALNIHVTSEDCDVNMRRSKALKKENKNARTRTRAHFYDDFHLGKVEEGPVSVVRLYVLISVENIYRTGAPSIKFICRGTRLNNEIRFE